MTKRLFSFLLASILMTCTCLSAFAADSQGGAISNTIGNVYNGASDVQSAVSDPVTWYVSNQIVGDSKYSDGIDLICPNGDYEEHYDDAFSSAVCPYDGEALIIKGNGVTFTPGGGSGNLGMGVGRKDLPGYTGGVSNVNRSGVLMLPMEHDFIATTNNSTFEPSTSTSSSYKSVFCPDYKGDYIVADSLGTNIEYSFSCSDDVFSSKMWSSDSSTTFYHGVGVSFKVTAPVDGYYAVYSSPTYSCGGYAPRDNSSYSRKDQKFSWYKGTSGYTSFSRSYYAKGQSIVINARPRIHYTGLWDIGYPSTSSYFYCYGVPILSVEPVDASSSNISNQTKIVINNNNVKNTWNGNVYVDASNHLTYIFPQYTYINENYEHVTSISENPIIYNSETNQYYTYSPTTNNYYYISYGEKTNPTPTPSPDPDSPEPIPKPSTPETAEGGDDNSGKILDVLYKIWDEIKNGFANVKVWSANIQTEISTSFTNFTAKFTEYSNNVKTWFTNLQSSFSTSITNLSNSIKLSIENLNVNIQNYFNKKLPNLPIGDFTIHPDATRRRIIPKMNTNEFEDSHGTWIASGSARYSTSHDYYMAFDGTSNCWEVNNTKPSILQIQIPDPENYFIDGYVLASLQYSSEYPKDWILQGSDDGETWVDLDTQTSQNLSDSKEHEYSLKLNKCYTYYRMYMTNYNSSWNSLSTFNLLGYTADDIDVATPSPSPSPAPDPVEPILPDAQNYIIPKMNSNTFTDEHGTWIASGSSKYSDVFDFFYAFDRSTANFWETNSSPSNLQIEIPDPESYYIDGYIMRISKFNNRYAKEWTLQGSDDGKTWDDLDKQTGQNLSDLEEHKYPLTLRKAYKYYRLNMSNYASSMCSLSHFNLLGYDAKDVVTPTPSPTDPTSPSPAPDPGTDPTPVPTPGGGTVPAPGGDSNISGGDDEGLFGWLWDLLKDLVKAILKAIFKILSNILGFLIWIVERVGLLLPFLPAPAIAALGAGVVLIFVIRIIRFIRG